jgi:DNA-binding MarR family transcriptional regulator
VLVALSKKGKRLVDQVRKRRGEIFSRALAQLSEVEQAEVITALEKVIAALEQYEAKLAIKDRQEAFNTAGKQ